MILIYKFNNLKLKNKIKFVKLKSRIKLILQFMKLILKIKIILRLKMIQFLTKKKDKMILIWKHKNCKLIIL